MPSKKESLQDKVLNLYGKICDDYYLNRDDLEINGKSYNSALLFGILTELNKGKMLLYGEYGGVKTTSAEYLNAIFNGLPLDLVKRVAIRGNPQLTEEKMIGRPHYGKMHQGEEDVVWQHFVMVGPKIIDEFNRIPESNQAVVLNGVDRGEWNYLNDFVTTGKQPFFATCNYSDKGNNDLIPPILDRFDIAVESGFPGVINALYIAQDYYNDKDLKLENPELTREALMILNSCKSYEESQKKLESIVMQHQEKLRNSGISIFCEDEKNKIDCEIRNIELDKDAEKYFSFLVSELNSSQKYGQKRSLDNPEEDKQSGLYLNSTFVGSGSRREEKSLVRYSKSLAWLQGDKKVNLDNIINIAPYVLWHRIKWTPETVQSFKDFDRTDPLDLYIAKNLFKDGSNELPGVKKRFVESQENYQRIIDLIAHGKNTQAVKEAKEFYAYGKGHPIFLEIIKDLGGK